jgi:hypothetical protein
MDHRSNPRPSTARRIFLLTASLAVGAVGWFLLGESERLSAAETAPPNVWARVDGVEVTADEVTTRAAAELRELERRRHALLSAATRERVGELLIRVEAEKRGVSVAELLAAEGDREALLRRLEREHRVEYFIERRGVEHRAPEATAEAAPRSPRSGSGGAAR